MRKDVVKLAERTVIINVRVDAAAKERAEAVLSRLGMSMSTAINLYLRQIAMRRAIPFEVSIPKPIGLTALTKEALDAELQKGKDDISAGRVRSRADLQTHFKATGRT